jgi:hypothetical protein
MPSDQSSVPPAGIPNPAVLDSIVHDPVEDRVSLVMVETRPWDGSSEQLFQIQEKINSYLSFALDGEMAETYPHLAGKPLGLRLDCFQYPDDKTIDFLDRIEQQLAKEKITFLMRVLEKASPSS